MIMENLLKVALVPWVTIALVIILLPFALWDAWVYSHLYTWFIRPLNPVFPPIPWLSFFGIILFLGMFRRTRPNEKDLGLRLVVGVVGAGLALLIGYIIKVHT